MRDKHVARRQRERREAPGVGGANADRDMDLAAFEKSGVLIGAGLHRHDMHAWTVLRIAPEEAGKDAFERVAGRAHAQHARITARERMRPFHQCTGVPEQVPRLGQELLALAGQSEAAA